MGVVLINGITASNPPHCERAIAYVQRMDPQQRRRAQKDLLNLEEMAQADIEVHSCSLNG